MYVLIHSPLVGPLTWSRVAVQLRERGQDVIVPSLQDSPDSKFPFWKQQAESVSQALAGIPAEMPVLLVGHSGAGPLLPVIGSTIRNNVRAYVFADAGIPHHGASRLDLMKSEDAEWSAQFQAGLEQGWLFPEWSSEDLQEVIPDPELRRQMVAELHPRGVSFFTEPIPVPKGWPDAPCSYIQFSAAYQEPAKQARAAGWPTYVLNAGHFHMLVNPVEVTDLIVNSVSDASSK
ncbi:MAG: alpha/beta fold hydrolase [Bacteroidota bacterium]